MLFGDAFKVELNCTNSASL